MSILCCGGRGCSQLVTLMSGGFTGGARAEAGPGSFILDTGCLRGNVFACETLGAGLVRDKFGVYEYCIDCIVLILLNR